MAMVRRAARLVRSFGLLVLFLAAALFGTASGVIFASIDDLPQIAALESYNPGTTTRVLGSDGSVIEVLSNERRQIISYDQIPPVLRNAIISAEDDEFFTHGGVSFKRIGATVVKRSIGMQKSGGASTLTQMLARGLFLTNDPTIERKIKEILLALQIEKAYTKEQIFTMFCNKIFLGQGANGVEEASQTYFGKHARELTLDEAAVIAGIIQSPSRQNPFKDLTLTKRRRDYTLGRMATERYITAAEADAAKKRPIVTVGQSVAPSLAPYFKETLRIYLEDRYGATAVSEGGLVIQTGLDAKLQRVANAALDEELRRLDKLRGYRRPPVYVEKSGRSLETYAASLNREPVENEYVPSVVTSVAGKVVLVQTGRWKGTIDAAGYEWTKLRADDVVRRGSMVEVKVLKTDAKAGTFTAKLDQGLVPTGVQGAVLAIDNHTGQILVMIGGSSFYDTISSKGSQFNRALQARRQVGSLFKPFVFTAAIDKGMTAADIIIDEPKDYLPGPNQPLYSPKNYENDYEGPMTLRHVLAHSRNVPTVKLMDILTPEAVVPYARALGIQSPIPAFLSTAIGAAEGTLLEMTSAYSAYPNQGVRMEPITIVKVMDREGNVLEENYPEPHEALKADTAAILTSMFESVVKGGTASSVLDLNWPLGGKTGTTDDFTDAWFVGFDPDITVGVWIGLDQKKTLGDKMAGAQVALPVWKTIMKSWIERRRAELPEKPSFPRPSNVVDYVMPDGKTEVFIAGTAPGKPVIEKH